ncbi:hypothetical protein C1N27_06855 [Vibrio diazotrophicus]|nr:hypothetical protein C1N27_06855 [Vibrio diazotrophicus]
MLVLIRFCRGAASFNTEMPLNVLRERYLKTPSFKFDKLPLIPELIHTDDDEVLMDRLKILLMVVICLLLFLLLMERSILILKQSEPTTRSDYLLKINKITGYRCYMVDSSISRAYLKAAVGFEVVECE